jgi:hypothetical protein
VYDFYNFETGKYSDISSSEILDDIRTTVDSIGPDILGFTSKDVGTHSNRSGCAMMMYLAGTPVYTIMLIGRWLLDAFLRYIEKQIKEFTVGVSEKMLLCNTFYNIPLRPWTSSDCKLEIRGAILSPLKKYFWLKWIFTQPTQATESPNTNYMTDLLLMGGGYPLEIQSC